eukprot:g27929.t1
MAQRARQPEPAEEPVGEQAQVQPAQDPDVDDAENKMRELGIGRGERKSARRGRPAGVVPIPEVGHTYYYNLNREAGIANFWADNKEGRSEVSLYRYHSALKPDQIPDYRLAVYPDNSVRLFRLMDNLVKINAYYNLDPLTIYKAYFQTEEA